MFLLRALPKYEALARQAERFPEFDVNAALACLSLMRVGSDVVANVEAHLAQHDISQGKFVVLMLLNDQPDKTLRPSEIAERADVTRTNITGLLDGLERSGLVQRLPNAEDRRALLVRLTDQGNARIEEIVPGLTRRISAMMRELSGEERETLLRLLAKVDAGETFGRTT